VSVRIAPYGAWESPLRATDAAGSAVGLAYVTARDGRLYWVEARPSERGRNALVTAVADGTPHEAVPSTADVRTRVHEYGGRPYVATPRGVLYAEFGDQRLRIARDGIASEPLTPDGYRYADGAAAPDGTTSVWVREDHTGTGEAVNAVVALNVDAPGAGTVLFDRSDFVAYPRPSRDGRFAFIAWDHPNMPWDGTALYVGRLDSAGLADLEVVAGGPTAPNESVLEPVWNDDGTLYFLSDRTGYWNLYRWRAGYDVEAVTHLKSDLGGPLWVLGQATYALTGDGRALVRICRDAVDQLALVDLRTGTVTPLAVPSRTFGSVGVLDARTGFAVMAPDDAPPSLVTIDLATGATRTVRSAGSLALPADYVARPEPISFATAPGPDGAPRSAHAFFYPPHNPRFAGPPGTRPPLIVTLHGGPTSHTSPALNLSVQYWTTRGFAVVQVNYGGSTGFGRAYRERLRGAWGVVDLQDAVAAVDHLVATGRVDGARVAIRGGSAGGYTVLAGLAFTRRFAAGINYFGVADLEALAADTHKFESRYLDSLVAPLPEGRAVYRARSPIHHLDQLDAALITFQGDEDKAVPPEQSRRIVAAVRARGKPVAYIEFAGEQHGFRQAANIARALEAELYFLGRIFGFVPADAVAPVAIDNLPPR
jgi:dipeptidyl aminopeptidase/acylaminoacyl peptidase